MGFMDFAKKVSPLAMFAAGSGLLGGKDKASNVQGVALPSFYNDPEFQKTQGYLSSLGINLLDGKIPDYYKGIGEQGGQEFNDYLNLQNADLTKSVMNAQAASGRNGGSVSSQVGSVVGKNTVAARYNDYARALEGKKFLFGAGKDITEGVRAAGLNNQQQNNSFNLDSTNIALQRAGLLDKQDAESGAAKGKALSGILKLALTAGGFAIGGPVGAAAGGAIGESVGGSNGIGKISGTDPMTLLSMYGR